VIEDFVHLVREEQFSALADKQNLLEK